MMTARILQGDVFDTLPTLEAGSMDCAIYSPPYWHLRDYSVCKCVRKRKKDPTCQQCDEHGKIPVVAQKQLGLEKTIDEYIANQVRVADLVWRALADHGTCFLNIGDTYSNTGGRTSQGAGSQRKGRLNVDAQNSVRGIVPEGIDTGNLCLVPQRLQLALQAKGWIVRSIVCWAKPAPMPSSVAGWRWMRCRVKVKGHSYRDRPDPSCKPQGAVVGRNFANDAEYKICPGCKKCKPHGGYVLRRGSWRPTSSWEPILMLAKTENYFCDGEAVKQPAAAATLSRDKYTRVLDDAEEQFAVKHDHETNSASGANPRDVRRVVPSKEDILRHLETLSEEEVQALFCPAGDNAVDVQTWGAEPLKEAHYAAYPSDLVEFCLRAGTSAKGYCPACGLPWCRVVEKEATGKVRNRNTGGLGTDRRRQPLGLKAVDGQFQEGVAYQTVDWRPSCNCIGGADMTPRPGRVLDPFSGSGRTGAEANRLGLDFTGCELNPDFCAMSTKILIDQSPLFNGLS
jgi:DNA modification methylase